VLATLMRTSGSITLAMENDQMLGASKTPRALVPSEPGAGA
jgi:hypothetical protein